MKIALDVCAASAAQAEGSKKNAILVVSFGTSYNDTRDATIGAVETAIKAAYPGYEVHRAFTSQVVINKLKSRDGLKIDNVTEAVERLVSDGVSTLIVQPTHVMHGFEYDDLMSKIKPYEQKFVSIKYGAPLLSSTQDYKAVAAALAAELRPAGDTALIFMGHGTEHFANAAYAALQYHFWDNGYNNILVGTVEGFPDLENVQKHLKARGVQKVLLTPLMIVAGDHSNNDMSGDGDDSWKTILTSAGYEVKTLLKGLGEYESIRNIYVSHVGAAIGSETEK